MQSTERTDETLETIRREGLWKDERILRSPQDNHVALQDGRDVLNLCANNYLGLANHPRIVQAAQDGLERWGYGMASVRFICGTQQIHRDLELALSDFLGTEDTILYSSCFDANAGLYETLLSDKDAVISDQLNHASIIDGVRLCKAKRYRYQNSDMSDLERQLQQADRDGAQQKLITTDGVFSMDGHIANLRQICDLAEQYNAFVHFDDCHATGFLGPQGRGTHALHDVVHRIDLTTGTLGKAMGGASGGYTSGRRPFIELLRQRSRPYLFSNSIAPPIVAASLAALELIADSNELRDRLWQNTHRFRQELDNAAFDIVAGDHPIVPLMLYDARKSSQYAAELLERGVYVVSFSYPVVPRDQARIRMQVSAAHTDEDLRQVVNHLKDVREHLG